MAIFIYSTSYLRQRTFPKQLNISRMSAYRSLSYVGSLEYYNDWTNSTITEDAITA